MSKVTRRQMIASVAAIPLAPTLRRPCEECEGEPYCQCPRCYAAYRRLWGDPRLVRASVELDALVAACDRFTDDAEEWTDEALDARALAGHARAVYSFLEGNLIRPKGFDALCRSAGKRHAKEEPRLAAALHMDDALDALVDLVAFHPCDDPLACHVCQDSDEFLWSLRGFKQLASHAYPHLFATGSERDRARHARLARARAAGRELLPCTDNV